MITANQAVELLKKYFALQCQNGLGSVAIEAFAPDGTNYRIVASHRCVFEKPMRHEIIMTETGEVLATRIAPLEENR